MNGFRMAAGFLLLVGTWTAPVSRAASLVTDASRTQAETNSAQVLVAPVLWMLGTLGVPVAAPAPLPNSERLERPLGWYDIACPVRDRGNGVYFEVQGRVEFERAEVRFADGTVQTVPLCHAVRGSGLYLLAEFGSMTAVDAVVLRARARSGEARVGVRLGR